MAQKNVAAGEKPRSYHHGDLRQALVQAADDIVREEGIEGFTLRAAARRAGVSPGAPAHHFGGITGLLTNVAILGYDELGTLLSVTDAATPTARMRAQAAAYVHFALDHPGRFRLMFRKDLVDRKDPNYIRTSRAAIGQLARSAEAAAKDGTGVDTHASVLGAWSLVHGIAHLALEDKFDSGEPNAGRDFRTALLPAILAAWWPD